MWIPCVHARLAFINRIVGASLSADSSRNGAHCVTAERAAAPHGPSLSTARRLAVNAAENDALVLATSVVQEKYPFIVCNVWLP